MGASAFSPRLNALPLSSSAEPEGIALTHSSLQARQLDKLSGSVLDSVLTQIGSSVRKMGNGVFDGAPEVVLRPMDQFFVKIWKTMQPELRETIMGPVPGDYSKFLLQSWPEDYPPLCPGDGLTPRPFWWFRARFNYALLPADCTLFEKLANPYYAIVTCLKLYSFTAVPVFGCQFILMDKRDEYQLVHFILLFKTFQFLTGVYTAITLSISFYGCLSSKAYEAATAPRACDGMISSADEDFPFIMGLEVVRVGLIAAAVWLLRSGYARGGPGELQALAEVRIDAADGSLDGFADTVAVDGGESAATSRAGLSYEAVNRATEANRVRFRATEATGNYLPYFMAFDFGALGLIVLTWLGSYLWRAQSEGWLGGEGEGEGRSVLDDPMFWTTCYYLKMYYALISFPFLVFIIPIFGEALHGANATGYDKSGLCVPKLSSSRIRQKKAIEAKAKAERNKLVQDPWLRVEYAWKIQYV